MKWFNRLIRGILVAGIALLLVDVALVFTIAWSRPNIPRTGAAIVLGAAINTPAIHNRIQEGLRLYGQGKINTLVLSGGRISDRDLSEAQFMQKVVNKAPQPRPEIILEEESHNTYENIKNSLSKLPQRDSVVIISDEFHLARAVLLAKRMGFRDVYWSAPSASYYRAEELRYYYLREIAGMIAYLPKFLFG